MTRSRGGVGEDNPVLTSAQESKADVERGEKTRDVTNTTGSMSVAATSGGGVFPRIAGARPLVRAAPWERGAQAAQTRVMPQTISPLAMKRKNNPANRVPEEVLRAASEHTTDPFWKQVLRDAAGGKWPRGFRFKSGVLSFQQKTKVFEEPINDDMDPAEVCERIVNFIKMRGDRQSERDRQRVSSVLHGTPGVPPSGTAALKKGVVPVDENAGAEHTTQCAVISAEAALKLKRCYPALFSQFVEDRAREHGLNLRSRCELLSALHFCNSMGWITNKTVEFEEGEQTSSHSILPRLRAVKCIEFMPARQRWEIKPMISRAYSKFWCEGDDEAPSIDELRAELEAEISRQGDPMVAPKPLEADFGKFLKAFHDQMKAQRLEYLLGQPLMEGEYLYSAVRSARDAVKTESPGVLGAVTPSCTKARAPASPSGTKARAPASPDPEGVNTGAAPPKARAPRGGKKT